MATMTCKNDNSAIRTATSEVLTESVRNFLCVQHAYTECSDEVQAVVGDMTEVFNSPDATEEEKTGALYTIVEAIFPDVANEVCDVCEQFRKHPQSREYNDRLRDQEQRFAEKVLGIMKEKHITQTELADRIGIGQSGVSNLLTRRCRPQKRTIEKIANALGVELCDLWSDLVSDQPRLT